MGLQSALQAMQIKSSINEYQKDPHFATIAKFASAEHLAHTVAYDLAANFDPSLPLIVVDEDGKTRDYKVTPIETANPAILGYILSGRDPGNPHVHVVFRGTACTASMVRDAEYGGAGQESFHAEKDLIMSQILAVVADHANQSDTKVQLTFSGHSLGGGDAQNCFTSVLEAMTHVVAHNNYKEKSLLGKAAEKIKSAVTLRPSGAVAKSVYAPLSVVESITLNHVNSAGVTHETAARCKRSAKYLSKHGVDINVRALRVAGDGIQLSGQTNVLNDVAPEVANVEVLKVHSGHEGWLSIKNIALAAGAIYAGAPALAAAGTLGTLSAFGTVKAHTAHNFNKTFTKADYIHVDNSTPEGAEAVKRKLSNKTFADNNPISHGFKKFMHTPLSLFVRNRKVSPDITTRHEEFKRTMSEHSLDADMLEQELASVENAANDLAETLKLKI